MEETIHINVEIRNTEDGAVSVSTNRLWPSLLRFTLTTMYSPIKGDILQGACLTIINNLALVIEGFITDLIVNEVQRTNLLIEFNPEKSTWSGKKKIYSKIFSKSLSEYPENEAIEILFLLRNNVAHGRSHLEIQKKKKQEDKWDDLKSDNKNYQKVREYLVRNKLLEQKTTPSNVDWLWQGHIASFFCMHVERFLFSIIKDLDEKQTLGISSELKTACHKK